MREENIVRQIMESKLYYHHDPGTGRYDWGKSVENIALSLNRPDLTFAIKYAIESAFNPSALTMVNLQNTASRRSVNRQQPLIAAVRDLGISPYVWTVGDIEWQQIKFNNCGVGLYTDHEHFLVAEENKKNLIGDWIANNHTETEDKLHLYIVDDKYSNLEEVLREYGNLAANNNIDFHPYHLKLNDQRANPTSFHHWLQNELVNHNSRERIEVFTDMDGVLIDTDGTMHGKAITNIVDLL